MQVEVLICTHNGARFLSEQLDSILGQSVPVDVIHIHDYASIDSTRDIILDYNNRYVNIQYEIFENAMGPAISFLSSMNLIKSNLGEKSILFLADQDDIWLSDKVSRVISAFQSDVDFVFHNVEVVDSEGYSSSRREYFYGNFWNVNRDFKLPNLYFTNPIIGHTIALTGRLLNRLDLNASQSIPMHDWHIAFQVLHAKSSFKYIAESLSLYRQHDSNLLGKKSIIRSIRRLKKASKTLGSYHAYLKEHYDVQIKYSDIVNIVPKSKLIYIIVLISYVKIFGYD